MKIFIVLALAVLLCSCVSVDFVSKDGTQVHYSRFWTNVGSIKANVGESNVEVNSSTLSLEALNSALGVLKSLSK